jgi:hypothetical protein
MLALNLNFCTENQLRQYLDLKKVYAEMFDVKVFFQVPTMALQAR